MDDNEQLVTLTTDIVAAHVSNNSVPVGDMGTLLQKVHRALLRLAEGAGSRVEKIPVVSVRASLKPDYIVCMECGRKQKMLKRHLQTAHGITPAEYRSAYGLAHDYPMSALNYSEKRRGLAKLIGLGRKKVLSAITGGDAKSAPVDEPAIGAVPAKASLSTAARRTKKPAPVN